MPRKQNTRRNHPMTRGMQAAPLRPRQIQSNVRFSHIYRFASATGATTAITATSLMCAAGTMCTVVNSTVTSFFGSVRVKRVEMFGLNSTLGIAATVSIEWSGTNGNTADIEFSDTSLSTAAPAHLNCRPPRLSLASFWNQAGTQTLFSITTNSDIIVDVEVELTLNDDTIGALPTSTVTTGVLGTVYYLSLDPNATHRFTPVSLTTTT